MYKLVILMESVSEPDFDDNWPIFLHLAERMPGLLREATSRVEAVVFGESTYAMIHELFFDSMEGVYAAMASPSGKQAGSLLQKMTQGKMSLLIADHKEDAIENLRKYRAPEEDEPESENNGSG